ncbi:MAG: endosialidase [Lachnospiraceae bacterium]|nr:endosialidase [Lachnospiraceae bacterium]
MAQTSELLKGGSDGKICFGDHTLAQKAKLDDYELSGDVYKVRTFQELTKLEKNDMFLYESVPGTTVKDFAEEKNGVSFTVSGSEDAQITVGLKEKTEYEVIVGSANAGKMSTGVSGKLSVSVELAGMGDVPVVITEA